MMLTKEELKVLDLFRRNLFKHYTMRGVMKALSKTSYGGIFDIIKKLKKLKIINIEKKGHSYLCNLNLKNNLTLNYLSLLEKFNALSKKHLPHKNIDELIKKIKTPFFIFIVTGSYAKNKQTSKSDLDVVIIIDDEVDKRIINTSLKKGKLMMPEVHQYIFTRSEFLKMLINKEFNYGKEIAKNKIIIYGAYAYYRILEEAIDFGYKG